MPLSPPQKVLLFRAFKFWCGQTGVRPEAHVQALFAVVLQPRVVQLNQMRVWLSTTRTDAVQQQSAFDANVVPQQTANAQGILDIDETDTVVQSGSL